MTLVPFDLDRLRRAGSRYLRHAPTLPSRTPYFWPPAPSPPAVEDSRPEQFQKGAPPRDERHRSALDALCLPCRFQGRTRPAAGRATSCPSSPCHPAHRTPARSNPSSSPPAAQPGPDNGGTLRGPHRTRSSHLLHKLGDWSSRAAAGVTASCLLAAWALVGAVDRVPIVVAGRAVFHDVGRHGRDGVRDPAHAATRAPWSFNASSMSWCERNPTPTIA